MTPREQGFLLLTGHLGDPDRRPLTVAQFRTLTRRAATMERPKDDRTLTGQDLMRIGCGRELAERILQLLSQTEQLQWYLEKGKNAGCMPLTRVSDGYPLRLRKRLGLDAAGVLWMKGDLCILSRPCIGLVGSRDLQKDNASFAWELGRQAALQGFVLVSGNARGADKVAQDSCLENGGSVISVVADELEVHPAQENVLYMAEDGFDLTFSTYRALQRNRVIHCLGEKTFVAQCTLGRGGTWDGTARNLKQGWTPVYCYDDGSQATRELQQMGAMPICAEALADISGLQSDFFDFFDP